MKKHVWRRPENIRIALERFLKRIGKPEQMLLIQLWQHWEMVMGADITALAWPLGSKNRVLLVGGEDAMSIQEISYMHHEMLERANAFMGSDYFIDVKARLSLDKKPLHALTLPQKAQRVSLEAPHPLSGKYLDSMPQDSPVARCYATYLRRSTE